MCSDGKSTGSAAWENLKVNMPLEQKLRLIARNVGIRIVQRQPCCGHPGEPGC